MKRKFTRITSMFLAMIMILAMAPTSALASSSTIIRTGTGMDMVEELAPVPFELDPEAVGTWVTYDFVTEFQDNYDPDRLGRQPSIAYQGSYRGCNIYDNGWSTQYHASMVTNSQWTNGYMSWYRWGKVVPGYTIQKIGERVFMFVEWKNGDYKRSNGHVPGYYVLEKVTKVSADPNAKENFIIDNNNKLIRYIGAGENIHVIVPEGITGMGKLAFGENRNIVEMTLPNSLKELDHDSVSGCYAMTTLNVGTGTENFREYRWTGSSFSGSPAIERINIDDDNPYMHDVDGVPFITATKELVMYPCERAGETYRVPAGTRSIRPFAFTGESFQLHNIIVPARLLDEMLIIYEGYHFSITSGN